MTSPGARRAVIILAATAALAAAIVIYAVFDPAANFFPRCPVKMATGLDCPGCGTQRALHTLLHGNFAGALRFNALLPFSFALLALLATASIMRLKGRPRLFNSIHTPRFIYALLTLITLWTIARNIWLPLP